ncbi:MAG: hypothetical protein DRP35_04345 [Candidatus Zixiibacteriota bacterium]|nr:MAG: hypothetical protein DRP35_04345 [candidate division Zixibacteria bacterium]
MIKRLIIFVLVLCCISSVLAQNVDYTIFEYDGFIPIVHINKQAASLQSSLFPDMYSNRSVERDMKWVNRNDSVLSGFWFEKGDTILHVMRELSGLEWYETEFDIYFIRFYTSKGSGNPVILPLGGIHNGSLIEAPPESSCQKLNLIYQMAKRMLDQPWRDEDSSYLSIMSHPLMNQTLFRRDNLAMLLALATANNVMGLDLTFEAYESDFWKDKFPGRTIFETYFKDKWVLSPEYPLLAWIEGEQWNSTLVRATRIPRRQKKTIATVPESFVAGLPIKGQFGFSVKYDKNNYLEVDKIDTYRLAYACGLREGDKIRRVDDKYIKNQKDLIEKIFQTFDDGGSTLRLIRQGETIDIIIQPLLLPSWEDDIYFDENYEENEFDTLLDNYQYPSEDSSDY